VGARSLQRRPWHGKDLNYGVTEDGYHLNGEKVKLNTITSKTRALIKAKGW